MENSLFIDDNKTEDPTPKKLADARQKGYVAKSQNLASALLIFASVAALFFLSHSMFLDIKMLATEIFTNLTTPLDSIDAIVSLSRHFLMKCVGIFFPLCAFVLIAGLFFNFAQTGFLLTFSSLTPQWHRINFFSAKNLAKVLSWGSVVRLFGGLLRISLAILVNIIIIAIDFPLIIKLSDASPKDVLAFIFFKSIQISLAISIIYIIIGIGDFFFRKWKFFNEMKMTRQEVKEEIKQFEGDLAAKAKIRTSLRIFAHDNIQKMISHADLVIIEPGKYAVALRYRPSNMSAPVCLCKGIGKKSIEIVNAARDRKVAIVENSHLAHSLYRGVGVESAISPKFYQEVAQAFSNSYKTKGSN